MIRRTSKPDVLGPRWWFYVLMAASSWLFPYLMEKAPRWFAGGDEVLYGRLQNVALAIMLVLVSLILVYAAYGVRQQLREKARTQRLRRGLCPSCGYDLTGNTSGACPECGAAVRQAERIEEGLPGPPRRERRTPEPRWDFGVAPWALLALVGFVLAAYFIGVRLGAPAWVVAIPLVLAFFALTVLVLTG